MVQEPLPAILVPQVLVCVKGPLIEMLPIVTALEIELLTVIFWTALVVPTSRAAKISVGGLNEMAEEVPMRLTTCGDENGAVAGSGDHRAEGYRDRTGGPSAQPADTVAGLVEGSGGLYRGNRDGRGSQVL